MSTRFRRPTGAPANVAELKYCSALMQTRPYLCPDATLTAVDIQHHLTSRHGVQVSLAQIDKFVDLAGGRRLIEKHKTSPSLLSASVPASVIIGVSCDDSHCDSHIELVQGAVMDPLDELEQGVRDDESGNPTTSDQQFSFGMDLLQQAALLLIPELQRIRQNGEDRDHSDESMHGEGPIIQAMLFLISKRASIERGVLLTKDVIRNILIAFDEWIPDDEDAENLVEEMFEACCNGGSVAVLDETTLIRALTRDTKLYNIEWDQHATTHYQDSMFHEQPQSSKTANSCSDERSSGTSTESRTTITRATHEESDVRLKHVFTASTIDNTTDNIRSFTWSIISWMAVVCFLFSYFLEGLGIRQTLPTPDCVDTALSSFGCKCLKGVVVWLEVFLELSILGASFLFFVSLGNSSLTFASRVRSATCVLAGLASVVFASFLSYKFGGILHQFNLVFGFVLVTVQLVQLIRILFGPDSRKNKNMRASGTLKLERWTKQAATHKAQLMLLNALGCHTDTADPSMMQVDLFEAIQIQASSYVACAKHDKQPDVMLGYLKQAESGEEVSGVLWFWRRIIFSQDLFFKEGVWLFPRLIVSNCVQWLVFATLPLFWVGIAYYVQQNKALFESTVEAYQLQIALAVGAATGLITTFSLACIYIPSAAATVLRYRSGLIDEDLQVYRSAVDNVTILFGSAFWGAAFSGFTAWIVVSAITFLLIWREIHDVVLDVQAFLFGLAVIIVLKTLLLRAVRPSLHTAFYRRRPALANFISVAIECWNLALSAGYILARLIKLFLLAILYIGRVDTFFLHSSVGWFGNVPLDNCPVAFRQDLLLHEAHRHPFIERLATLYMLKLRHQENFGNRGSATWRIVLVRALMPWLEKYRILHRTGESAPSNANNSSTLTRCWESTSQRCHRLERELQRLRTENIHLKESLKANQDHQMGSTAEP